MARRLTEMAPNNEAGWRTCMWLHYLSDDLAAAIGAQHDMVASLGDRRPSAESEELWRVVERAAAASPRHARSNPALDHPPQLVGRQPKWQAMSDAAALGQPFLLRGESGIGKSRLLRSFLAQWRGRIIVKCVSGDRDAPYATLAQLLRALSDEDVRPGPTDRYTLSAVLPQWRKAGTDAVVTDASKIHGAVRSLLEKAVVKGVGSIGIDDLHHCDLPSLTLWGKLTEGDAVRRPRFGFAARPVADSAVQAAIDVWRGETPPLKVIDLLPLSSDDVAQLLPTLKLVGPAAAVGADALFAHAGGNPRVLLETLRDVPLGWAPGQQLPLSGVAKAVLERRIRELPTQALQLLQLSAVLDDHFGHAAQALGWPAPEFEACCAELQTRHVLRADGRFANDTMRDVALASLTAQELVHWHGVAAAAMKDDPRVSLARIAKHWEAALQRQPAGAAYRAAALLANNAGSAGEARGLSAPGRRSG